MSEPEVDRIRALQRTKHYSIRAEEAHVESAKRILLFEASQGIATEAGPHALRQPFATYLLESRKETRTVQELLRRSDVKATRIDTHVLGLGASVRRPLDTLESAAASPSHPDG